MRLTRQRIRPRGAYRRWQGSWLRRRVVGATLPGGWGRAVGALPQRSARVRAKLPCRCAASSGCSEQRAALPVPVAGLRRGARRNRCISSTRLESGRGSSCSCARAAVQIGCDAAMQRLAAWRAVLDRELNGRPVLGEP